MRINTSGKFDHREQEIQQAADFWDASKTQAVMKSIQFSREIDRRIQTVLSRDDLTLEQQRELAETLSVGSLREYRVENRVETE